MPNAASLSTQTLHRITNYTPTQLPPEAWAYAAEEVRRAALLLAPTTPLLAVKLMSALVGYLASHPGWDKRSVPNLKTLLGSQAMQLHLSRRGASGSMQTDRATLRRFAVAVGAIEPSIQIEHPPIDVPADMAAEVRRAMPFRDLDAAAAAGRRGRKTQLQAAAAQAAGQHTGVITNSVIAALINAPLIDRKRG